MSFRLLVRAGAMQEPAGKPGVASFVASLLNQGTSTKSAGEIATPGRLGGRRHRRRVGQRAVLRQRRGHQGSDRSRARHRVGPGPASGVFARRDRSPAPADAVVAAGELRRSGLPGRPRVRSAGVRVPSVRPPERGHARIDCARSRGTIWSRSISTWFVPNNSLLAIVGDLTAEEAFAAAEKAFGSWTKRDVPTIKPVEPPPPTPAHRRDRPSRVGADGNPRRTCRRAAHAPGLPAARPRGPHSWRRRRQSTVWRAPLRTRAHLRRVGGVPHLQEQRRHRGGDRHAVVGDRRSRSG